VKSEAKEQLKPNTDKTETPKRKCKFPTVRAVRFTVPPKAEAAATPASESDDDEDMADYFDMEISKTEAELGKLRSPKLPLDIVARFAATSHGSMVKILNESEGLTRMLGEVPEGVEIPNGKEEPSQAVESTVLEPPQLVEETLAPPEAITTNLKEEFVQEATVADEAVIESTEIQSSAEKMDVDEGEKKSSPSPTAPIAPVVEASQTEVPSEATTKDADEDNVAKDIPSVPAVENKVPPPPAIPPIVTNGEPKAPSTPSQVEDEGDEDATESEDDVPVDVEAVRRYMATPPLDSLPVFEIQPWDKDAEYLASLAASDSIIDNYILDHLKQINLEKRAEQLEDKRTYARNYLQYLDFTVSDDPVATRSRDKFSVAAPTPDPVAPTTPEPKPEGRSTGRRFASERDLERVLQASMREDEERKERELRIQKEKYRSEKEAMIPMMYWNEDEKEAVRCIDRTGYTPPDRLVSAWQILPPVNNFTTEEAELLEKRYLEFPKQWGRVAEVIPHRNFGDCIQYYYLMKKELNLKEKLKRQPKRRKKGGRGKQRSSALVSELGNGEQETEENNEGGENGESRRRPRRAAAPTWGFEQPNTDSDNAASAATPGRRGGSAANRAEQGEKVDGRKGRRKTAKDKEAKLLKPNQALAAAPAPSARSRSRSEGKTQNIEPRAGVSPEPPRLPTHFEQQAGMQAPFVIQQPPLQPLERPQAIAPQSSMADVMAAPSLRPEPPPPHPPAMTTFNLAQPQQERKAPTQASSYWSVSEANDFPQLLKAFGSDWTAIATHMGSKTAVMVSDTCHVLYRYY
jgi:hypothetical protein